MEPNKPMTEKESLQLITDMLQKVKYNHHHSGTSALLWGSVVAIAALVSFFQAQFDFRVPFDIWLIVLCAIIPQVYISIKESKNKKFKSHEDKAIDAVWMTYAITIFGLTFYQNLVPSQTNKFIQEEGWQMMQHYPDGSKPDEILKTFIPSLMSLYILVFAMPTLITGWVKNFRPMIIGAFISYGLFIASLFTITKYDMLMAAVTAIVCWFIPGIILRRRYLKARKNNV